MRAFKILAVLSLILFYSHCWANDKVVVTVNVQPKKLQALINGSLGIMQYQDYAVSSQSRMTTAFNLGYQQIQQTLHSQGYFKAKVSGAMHYDNQSHTWNISYTISPGPLLNIAKVEIDLTGPGRSNPVLQKLIQTSPLVTGTPLQLSQYNTFKSNLQNAAISQGYFEAQYLTHQIQISLKPYQAIVILKLNTGKQYHFGQIQFKTSIFSNKFLNRFVPFKSGQPYQQTAVDTLQSNLASSGYFDSVSITPEPDKRLYTVPITISLNPKPPQQYQIGGGYGTDTGIRGLLGWKLRYIGQNGQYLSAQIQAAKNFTNFTMSYVIPGTNPLTDYSSLNAGRSYTNITAYTATDIIVGADHVVQYGPWQTSLGLTQHFIQATEPANLTESPQKYLLPDAGLSYSNLSQNGYFKQGYAWSGQVQAAAQNVLSNTSFAQGILRVSGSWSLDSNDRVYIKLLTGATAVSNLSNLSPIFRFYAGGVDSVRGYSYKSLGPTDSNGNLIGGRYIASSNINFERHIWSNWSGLLFYDIGNAFNNISEIDLQKGAGAGASWHSPIGTINFYLAHPVQPIQGPWRIDIGIETLL